MIISEKIKRYVKLHQSLMTLVEKLRKEKGFTEKEVADCFEDGMTLNAIAKLEVLFQEPLIKILENE